MTSKAEQEQILDLWRVCIDNGHFEFCYVTWRGDFNCDDEEMIYMYFFRPTGRGHTILGAVLEGRHVPLLEAVPQLKDSVLLRPSDVSAKDLKVTEKLDEDAVELEVESVTSSP